MIYNISIFHFPFSPSTSRIFLSPFRFLLLSKQLMKDGTQEPQMIYIYRDKNKSEDEPELKQTRDLSGQWGPPRNDQGP